jgi:hypothetical protein
VWRDAQAIREVQVLALAKRIGRAGGRARGPVICAVADAGGFAANLLFEDLRGAVFTIGEIEIGGPPG